MRQPSLYLHLFPGYMTVTYFQSALIGLCENCPVGTGNHGTYLFFPFHFGFYTKPQLLGVSSYSGENNRHP